MPRRMILRSLAYAFVPMSLCVMTLALAEDAPYAEYRWVSEMGQIQIVTGFMDRTSDLSSRVPALEKKGIVVLETDKTRTFTRTERVGTHQVETRITIPPPAGHGEGGAGSNADLKMIVDGKTRVDCPLWHASLGLDRIVLEPSRGFITLSGHDGILRFDGFEPRGLVDSDWLTKRADSTRQLITGKK